MLCAEPSRFDILIPLTPLLQAGVALAARQSRLHFRGQGHTEKRIALIAPKSWMPPPTRLVE